MEAVWFDFIREWPRPLETSQVLSPMAGHLLSVLSHPQFCLSVLSLLQPGSACWGLPPASREELQSSLEPGFILHPLLYPLPSALSRTIMLPPVPSLSFLSPAEPWNLLEASSLPFSQELSHLPLRPGCWEASALTGGETRAPAPLPVGAGLGSAEEAAAAPGLPG